MMIKKYMVWRLAVLFAISAWLLLIGVACFAAESPATPSAAPPMVHDMDTTHEKDGSVTIKMTPREAETCARGDGCVMITQRQLNVILAIIGKMSKEAEKRAQHQSAPKELPAGKGYL